MQYSSYTPWDDFDLVLILADHGIDLLANHAGGW